MKPAQVTRGFEVPEIFLWPDHEVTVRISLGFDKSGYRWFDVKCKLDDKGQIEVSSPAFHYQVLK